MRKAILVLVWLTLFSASAQATPLTFNASIPSENAARRAQWLTAAGIASPQHLVDFETGFVDFQNVSGFVGLFPGSLVITDSSSAHQARVRTGAGEINGSNPVGSFCLTQNELPYLELDFSARPIDYLGFLDIDHSGTTGVAILVDGSSVSFSFETTGFSGNTAEFFGIFRDDAPRIAKIRLDASGDGLWGIDNIEYGTVPVGVPDSASSLTLLGLGLAGLAAWRRRLS